MSELGGRRLRGLTLLWIARMLRAGQNREARDLRDPFFQQLDALADQIERQIAHTRKRAAGSREAFDQLAIDRIAAEAEHYRCRRFHRPHRVGHQLLRDDHVGSTLSSSRATASSRCDPCPNR